MMRDITVRVASRRVTLGVARPVWEVTRRVNFRKRRGQLRPSARAPYVAIILNYGLSLNWRVGAI